MTRPPTCWKPDSSWKQEEQKGGKGQKKNKSEFVTKPVGIILTIIFIWNYYSKC